MSATRGPAATVVTASPGRGPRRRRPRPAAWGLLCAALVVALAVRVLVIEPMRIGSDSMAPTLAAGEHVLIDKLRYRTAAPRSGELAAFEDAGSDDVLLKRIVAVGGDTVGIEDGVLVVNGDHRPESYVDPGTTDSVYFGPVTVPAGSVFVLGDNRANSIDSRSFGAVEIERLIGPVAGRLWPPGRWHAFS